MEIRICDICKTRDSVNRTRLVYGRENDGASSKEDMIEIFDLCKKCEVGAYKFLIKSTFTTKELWKFNSLLITFIWNEIKKRKENK